ncbi:MAG: ABC transporter permease [Candidatus Krumholzibacteriia bacterium]
MNFASYIARRHLRSRRHSVFLNVVSVIAVTGIVIGVAVLNLVLAIMNGFRAEIQRTFVENMPMVSVVTSAPEGFTDLPLTLATIAAEPEVTGVTPLIRQEVIVSAERPLGGARHRAAVVWGVDVATVSDVLPVSGYVEPAPAGIELLAASGTPHVILGIDLAHDLYAGLGDTVLVTAPRGELILDRMEAETRRFVVAGFIDSGMYEFDSRFVYIDLATARDFFGYGEQGATLVGAKLERMMRAGAVADSLEVRLGRYHHATDWISLNSNLFRWINIERIVMYVFLGLIVLVAAFNIVGILIMMVGDRHREIGILLAMGASRGQIMGIFVLNGMWLGIAGTALGSLLGWLGITVLRVWPVGLPGDVYFLDHVPVLVQGLDFVLVAAGSLVLTFLATLGPSAMASRMEPMGIIRYT